MVTNGLQCFECPKSVKSPKCPKFSKCFKCSKCSKWSEWLKCSKWLECSKCFKCCKMFRCSKCFECPEWSKCNNCRKNIEFFLFFNHIILCKCFLRRYFFLSFHPIDMKFGHNIPRVVRCFAMIFLSHPSFSSRCIQNILYH